MPEDVFRAIKPSGTGATPTIGRATMLQVVTKVSRIRGIRPRASAKRVNNGLLSAQFDLTERAKVHRLNSFCLRYLFQAASIHLRCCARDFSPPREDENANERISVQFSE